VKKLRVLTLAAILAAPAASWAQDLGFYVGGSLGQAKAKEYCDTGGIAGLAVSSCDNKATAWKAFAGYKFHPNFAVEGTYIRTDDFTASATFSGVPFTVKSDGRSFGLAGLGIWPVSQQFSVFGKLGFLRTEAESTATVAGTTIKFGENESEVHYGLGALYNLTRNWGVRAEWERANKSKLEIMSIGVQYQF
jgi:OmpA-OmpF porin, OOP family